MQILGNLHDSGPHKAIVIKIIGVTFFVSLYKHFHFIYAHQNVHNFNSN